MADLVYRIGVKKLLDHFFDSTLTLENATNCLFAVLVQDSYTAAETDTDMTAVTTGSHEWDGVAANGGYETGANSLPVTVASVSTGTDGSGRLQLILPNLAFGNVTTAGSPVAGCVLYVEDDSAAADTARWPLVYLDFTSAVQPVASQSLTIVSNTNGLVLFDPNA